MNAISLKNPILCSPTFAPETNIMTPPLPKIDSVSLLQNKVDSLRIVLAERHIFNIHDSPVQAAAIIATTTLLTVVLGFIFKDMIIPGLIENRVKRKARHFLFAKYKYQLFHASLNFEKRLHELSRTRSHYLWAQTNLGSFYDYKYKSCVYRLCALLGWLRAFKLLESSFAIKGHTKEIHEIVKVIREVESCFADGQRVEMYIAKSICKLISIDDSTLPVGTLEKLSIEIDNLIQKFQNQYDIEYVADLVPQGKTDFIIELKDTLTNLNISTNNVQLVEMQIINEASIKLALIYRDWQQAIGDLMIVRTTDQSFEVISFRAFEEIWQMDVSKAEKKWLTRAERMFKNLDMQADRKGDSRIHQLEELYKCLFALMKVLYNSKIGARPIDKIAFDKLSPTIQ